MKKIPTELIHPNVSDLPGLLLQVLLAVHSTVDQQHARTEIRQVGYLWKGLEKVCKLPDNDVFKDTKSGQKWKTLAIVCPICCNCHTLCLMAGVVKFNFQIGGDTEPFTSPPGNQIWRTMFGKKGFDSRLNVAARNQSPFLYFIFSTAGALVVITV